MPVSVLFRLVDTRCYMSLYRRKPGRKFLEGNDDRLLSGANFLLAKLAVLKHLTQ